MRLHELDFKDGNEYEMCIGSEKNRVRTSNQEIYLAEGMRDYLTDDFSLKDLANATFTKIEKKLTFLEAYNDCLVNWVTYEREPSTFSDGKVTMICFGNKVTLQFENEKIQLVLNGDLWKEV